jgi:hypothetical protein
MDLFERSIITLCETQSLAKDNLPLSSRSDGQVRLRSPVPPPTYRKNGTKHVTRLADSEDVKVCHGCRRGLKLNRNGYHIKGPKAVSGGLNYIIMTYVEKFKCLAGRNYWKP